MDNRSGNSKPNNETRHGFKFATGMMGSTESGQKVTPGNISLLPPGSVVRNSDGSRHIHLHDFLWLWCKDGIWTYDRAENLAWRLDKKSVACHVAPVNIKMDSTTVKTSNQK